MLDIAGSGNTLVGWHLKLVDQAIPLDLKGAEDVVVAVLDTAQHPDLVRSAATRPELRRNWLLQRLAADLRNEEGLFSVEYDRYPITNDVCTGRDTQNDASYYFMPDHGLAVSGLIRDMAPNARIRLVRVLNDYGGGDLHSVFAALTDLERELMSGSIRRLVINLSLTIMPDLRRLPYIWFANRQWPTSQLMGVIRVLSHIEEGLRLLFESLFAQGALIVAAAGNDSTSTTQQQTSLELPRRPPRAPARYESVFSVSAVNSKLQPSSFANAANIPSSTTGIATFGGDGYGSLDANALPDAARVLYIAPTFPSGEPNLSGWADWSGTSFATGIISGVSAHLMARSMPALNVINRLAAGQQTRSDQLFGSIPAVPAILGNILRVQQRFNL